MPRKSKRVASRQAQLSQRGKHKGRHGPTGIPTQQPQQRPRESEHETELAQSTQGEMAQAMTGNRPPAVAPEARAASLSQAPLISRGSHRGRQPLGATAAYHVKREMVRIGLLSSVVIAILVALSFVLR